MEIPRVKTGVLGFDAMIGGGFLHKSMNMISGGPGTGKTIFGLQFIWNGAVKYGDRGLYISFEEDAEDLMKDAASFGWDFKKLEKLGRAKIVYHTPYELASFSEGLAKEIMQYGAKRIVIDSSSVIGLALKDTYAVRKFLFELAKIIKKLGCVAIITTEVVGNVAVDVSEGIGMLSRFGVEEFISDSVTTMHFAGLGGESDRMLRVLKMRRTDQHKELTPFDIGRTGVIVHYTTQPKKQ